MTKKTPGQKLRTYCDDLWANLIVRNAGHQSEYSGIRYDPDQSIYMVAHHLVGKPNYKIRYELRGGVCLTFGEHKWRAHNIDRVEEFRERVKEIRGATIFEELEEIKRQGNIEKTKLQDVKIMLEEEMKCWKK